MCAMLLFSDVVATSSTVAATRSRLTKVDALATLLRRAESPPEIETVVAFLAGAPRQGRGPVGVRPGAGPPGPPDARLAGRVARGSVGGAGFLRRRVQTGRCPDPGAQAGRRGPCLHQEPARDHQERAGAGRGRARSTV